MYLQTLNRSRQSLEFSIEEWQSISRRLQQFGNVSREQFATFDLLRVGREIFIFLDEWDDLSLISQSSAGDLILKRVANKIGAGFSGSLLRQSFRSRRHLAHRMPSRAA